MNHEVETIISVNDFDTVNAGQQKVWARYVDMQGKRISGATVTVTGDSACLPVTLKEQSGKYSAMLNIPPDSDGMRTTMKVMAHKPGFAARSAYISYFTADETWIVRNDHVERCLLGWASSYEQYVTLEYDTCYEGYRTYAMTITDRSITDANKVKLIFIQSHGHEPGSTAAIMDIINQILTGKTLEGRPTKLERDLLLKKMLLVFVPIGNASSRERCPVQYWGDQFDRETMKAYIYGKLAGETSWWHTNPISVLHRSEQELDPTYPIALRWEQVDEETFFEPFHAMAVPSGYVEPSQYQEICANIEQEPMYKTALWRLVKRMLDRHTFKSALDLHQMNIPGRLGQVWIRPRDLKGWNRSQLLYAHEVATRIEEDWRAEEITVLPRNLLIEKDLYLTITDFIHICGRGNPVSFFIEACKGPGTTKKVKKKVGMSAIQSMINFIGK